MTSFYNDYDVLCHPSILEDLSKYQAVRYKGYSTDEHVGKAIQILKRDLGKDNIDIHFVHSGTCVNVLGLILSMRRYDGVISCDSGHIVNTESGSIEAVGHQIVQIPNKDGKVTIEEIEKVLERYSGEFSVNIKTVYISNATEYGTVYKKSELEELHKFCKEKGLYLFMDGARIGTALASEKNEGLEISDLVKYFDVFSIGGTKNGMLLGEALVVVNDDLKFNARKLIKQRGALLAKGYLYGIQFETMFRDGLYYKLANHAYDMAKEVAASFVDYGFNLAYKQESNLVFVNMTEDEKKELSKTIEFDIMARQGNVVTGRFVTTWHTDENDLSNLKKALERLRKNSEN